MADCSHEHATYTNPPYNTRGTCDDCGAAVGILSIPVADRILGTEPHWPEPEDPGPFVPPAPDPAMPPRQRAEIVSQARQRHALAVTEYEQAMERHRRQADERDARREALAAMPSRSGAAVSCAAGRHCYHDERALCEWECGRAELLTIVRCCGCGHEVAALNKEG